jgi:hypothetical protein
MTGNGEVALADFLAFCEESGLGKDAQEREKLVLSN